MLITLVWSIVASGFAYREFTQLNVVMNSPALTPTAEGQKYWTAVLNADSSTLCQLEDLTQTGESMEQCVAGWDQALAAVKAEPQNEKPRIVHQATIKLGPNYWLDGYTSFKPDGTEIISMALLIADGKIEGVL